MCFLTCSVFLFHQLPHMPHINECLMKRSLKPTDLRDMTLGQLQVIVNDLHSQIESELTTHKHTLACKWARQQMGKNMHMHPDPSVDVKVLLYMLVSSKKCRVCASPRRLLLLLCTDQWPWCCVMNNSSSYIKQLKKIPFSPNWWATFYLLDRVSPQNCFCWSYVFSGIVEGTVVEAYDVRTTTATVVGLSTVIMVLIPAQSYWYICGFVSSPCGSLQV